MKKIIGMVIVLTLVFVSCLSGCVSETGVTVKEKIANGIIKYQIFHEGDNTTTLVFEGGSHLVLCGEHEFDLNREITITCGLDYCSRFISHEYEDD